MKTLMRLFTVLVKLA